MEGRIAIPSCALDGELLGGFLTARSESFLGETPDEVLSLSTGTSTGALFLSTTGCNEEDDDAEPFCFFRKPILTTPPGGSSLFGLLASEMTEGRGTVGVWADLGGGAVVESSKDVDGLTVITAPSSGTKEPKILLEDELSVGVSAVLIFSPDDANVLSTISFSGVLSLRSFPAFDSMSVITSLSKEASRTALSSKTGFLEELGGE